MSEEQPKPAMSNTQTMLFMMVLSLVCAIILSVLASALAEPKAIAKELDRNKQLLIAAKILDHQGHLLIKENGHYIIAKSTPDGTLEPGSPQDVATQEQLLKVYQNRIEPLLVDEKGNVTTFAAAKINEDDYVEDFKKTGYYKQPLKLIYAVLPNISDSENKEKKQPTGYVIPVNGYGLWDAIYGYLAIETDGDTVTGISWYDQKETPGLGANISEPEWQSLFPGKKIFQPTASGETDFKTAPLGITVVKGKVIDVFGNSPKAESAVDGMSGATLTGNGVTDAYRDVLAGYRPFLIKIHKENQTESSK